jgi:hypothetical protein
MDRAPADSILNGRRPRSGRLWPADKTPASRWEHSFLEARPQTSSIESLLPQLLWGAEDKNSRKRACSAGLVASANQVINAPSFRNIRRRSGAPDWLMVL